jgi:YVTN family beta-propeller protein
MTRYVLTVLLLISVVQANAKTTVRTVDFLGVPGVTVNAAGPVLVQMDEARNRLIVANTLTSSLSIIDCSDHSVENISLGGRALQHLKAASMTINKKTGDIYLVGARCLLTVSGTDKKSRVIRTDVQFESIAVEEQTGNVFVVGRESKGLGYLKKGSDKIKVKKWCETSEPLINLNQTPPPPIRRVITDNTLGQIIALDGYTSMLYVFNAKDGKLVESRTLGLTSGGRWHFAGYDEEDHALYLVVETDKRKVIEAAMIDVFGGGDVIVPLPEHTEGVGIIYNPVRKEIYVPYDNHPTVHVVNFDNGGTYDEIKIPAYGNDASAVDSENDLLYIGSWAFGEVGVIDLKTRKLQRRIENLGIIPHMFTMAFNPNNNRVYFPKGASAVNGTFGAAVTVLDPNDGSTEKVRTGWAPIDLIDLPDRGSVVVFNSEDQYAEVRVDGTFDIHALPYDYPVDATHNADGDVYLSYGPHQSYWPTVYIWGAKNGVLTIDSEDFSVYDRRIPRQAHEMALDKNGVLYFTQNNWGREEQFVGVLKDPVRVYESGDRLGLEDEVEREITQRILEYDPATERLYLVRVGEKDEDPSVLQVIDPAEKKVVSRIPLGNTATDLVFDDDNIYVANFGSASVSVIDKSDFTANEIETGEGPLRLCSLDGRTYVISHMDNRFQEIGGKSHKIPFKGRPDNVFVWGDIMILTSHNDESMAIMEYDPDVGAIKIAHRQEYPYGDVRFDTPNVSFYVKGQFGDAVFEITRGVVDAQKRLWISDFLAGKLYIVESH